MITTGLGIALGPSRAAIGVPWIVDCLSGCASAPREGLVRPDPVWSIDFRHAVSYHNVIGDDLLIVCTTRHLWGIDPADAGTHVLVVDRSDGALLWESPVLKGRIFQARLDYRNKRLFVVVEYPHSDGRGLFRDLLPNKCLLSELTR